jgi:hypothetical protein
MFRVVLTRYLGSGFAYPPNVVCRGGVEHAEMTALETPVSLWPQPDFHD